ncbi:MAG TPA: hypothetical protein VFV70_08995 [Hyphomonadaceae bacterium]|nr:hypothetical protein [Hyphomonadaceae bacterium]
MSSALVIVHVLALMLGSAGGFGALLTLGHARPKQKEKGGSLRGVGRVFSTLSLMGILVLWPTGIALVVTHPESYPLNPMFWMKVGFAVVLTIATVSIEVIYGRAKHEPHLARLLPSLKPLAALSYIMTAVFSVLAFH